MIVHVAIVPFRGDLVRTLSYIYKNKKVNHADGLSVGAESTGRRTAESSLCDKNISTIIFEVKKSKNSSDKNAA